MQERVFNIEDAFGDLRDPRAARRRQAVTLDGKTARDAHRSDVACAPDAGLRQ